MEFAGSNNNLMIQNFINQPVFPGDAARPVSSPIPLERLRLAGSVKGISHYFCYQGTYLVKNLCIIFFPLSIFSESSICKTNHCFAACSACSGVSKVTNFPSSASLMTFSMCSRLAGVLRRNSVSSCSRTCISTTWSGYVVLIEFINVPSKSLVFSLYVVTILIIIVEIQGIARS